jgi:23S rRNA pseudouridine1911/1915/1917 synthase
MRVLHCDNHVLAVYKPAGLPVQADRSGDPDLLTLAKSWVAKTFDKPGAAFVGLVHRLDRPARGVVVLARTSKGAARLSTQFRDRTVRKTYEVVVHGRPAGTHGRLQDWLVTSETSTRVVQTRNSLDTGRGQLAELDWQLLGHQDGLSWLRIDLHSGRKHQIRVQWASRGLPVLGDLRYGAPYALPDRSIALLARRLEVSHPTTAERLAWTAADPHGWPWGPDEPR